MIKITAKQYNLGLEAASRSPIQETVGYFLIKREEFQSYGAGFVISILEETISNCSATFELTSINLSEIYLSGMRFVTQIIGNFIYDMYDNYKLPTTTFFIVEGEEIHWNRSQKLEHFLTDEDPDLRHTAKQFQQAFKNGPRERNV